MYVPVTQNFNFGLDGCIWSMMNLTAEFLHNVWPRLWFFFFFFILI